MYSDIPAGDNEIIARIGDADAVLLSYTSQNKPVYFREMSECPVYRYVLFNYILPKSANVDIRYAK